MPRPTPRLNPQRLPLQKRSALPNGKDAHEVCAEVWDDHEGAGGVEDDLVRVGGFLAVWVWAGLLEGEVVALVLGGGDWV